MSKKFDQSKRQKNKRISIYDDDVDDEEECDEWETKSCIQAQWDEIYRAIDENNADLLYTLLPPINLHNSRDKYWVRNPYWIEYCRGNSILCRAVELEHSDCVEVILNKIRNKNLPHRIVDYSNEWPDDRTALIIACEKGHLNIIEKLIDHDPTNYRLSTAFFKAVERRDEVVMNYLVKRCNLRTTNHYGRTALDWTISQGYIETAKLLIQYGETTRNQGGFSPMMSAAHHDLSPLVDLLFQRLPQQEAVDKLILLASHYIITDDVSNRQKAFDLFVRGLNEGELVETNVSHEVYEYRCECKTVDQLLAIWNDENALRMHALIISERILVLLSDINPLMIFINQQCNFDRNNHFFHRSVQLRIHAHHLFMRHRICFDNMIDWKEWFFTHLIEDLHLAWTNTGLVPIELIDMASACIFSEGNDDYLSHIFNLLATISHLMEAVTNTTKKEQHSLFTFAQRAIRYDTMNNSLLVHYLLSNTRHSSTHLHPFYTVSILSIVRLMIECGVNVNGIASHRSHARPLHEIATCRNTDNTKAIIELLLAHGAHADCIDDEGHFPQDLAREPAIKELLCITRKLSLKCRCAEIIVSKRINYRNCLSPNLLTFVRLHTNTETN